MLKPIGLTLAVTSAALGGLLAWGVYETKAAYNQQFDKFINSETVTQRVVVNRTVLDDGFFGQVERIEFLPHPSLDIEASLAYTNDVSFSLFEAEGKFKLDTQHGVIGQHIADGTISGLKHSGKWAWTDRLEVSHETSSFKVDSQGVDVSVSPLAHAFYLDTEKGNGEYRLTFGGLLVVEQDRSRLQVSKVRSEGFVQVSDSGHITLPQKNTSVELVDFSNGAEQLKVDNLVLSLQELEDNGFLTLNNAFSVDKVEVKVPQGNHSVSNVMFDTSLRHVDREGYDLVRDAVHVEDPKQKQLHLRQAAAMIAAEGFAVDINDVSMALDGHRSGLSGTVSLKPVDLRDLRKPSDLVPHLGGNLALTINSNLANAHPGLKQGVRQGIAMGLLTLDKDGNPAMFAELNSGQLLVNGKPMM